EAAARVRLEKSQVTWAIASAATPSVGMQSTVADAARFSDLVVAPLPYGKDYSGAGVQVVEAALFGGQVPVLIVPGTLPAAFPRAGNGWDRSPGAVAGIRAGLAVLWEAKGGEIGLVGPPSYGPGRSGPGGRLQQMLTRHGVAAS